MAISTLIHLIKHAANFMIALLNQPNLLEIFTIINFFCGIFLLRFYTACACVAACKYGVARIA
jgi:hypothetical protein